MSRPDALTEWPAASMIRRRYSGLMTELELALRREARRELLAALSPGGSPECPIEVTSAAVIDGHVEHALSCPLCRGSYRLHEHTRPAPGLRRVDVACRRCSTPRVLWFTIVDADPLN